MSVGGDQTGENARSNPRSIHDAKVGERSSETDTPSSPDSLSVRLIPDPPSEGLFPLSGRWAVVMWGSLALIAFGWVVIAFGPAQSMAWWTGPEKTLPVDETIHGQSERPSGLDANGEPSQTALSAATQAVFAMASPLRPNLGGEGDGRIALGLEEPPVSGDGVRVAPVLKPTPDYGSAGRLIPKESVSQTIQAIDGVTRQLLAEGASPLAGPLAVGSVEPSSHSAPRQFLGDHIAVSSRADIMQSLRRGYGALVGGRPEAALAAYDQALSLDEADPDALMGRAVALHRLGRLIDARAAYDALLHHRPDHREALVNLAALLAAELNGPGVDDRNPRAGGGVSAGRATKALSALLALADRYPRYSPVLAQVGVGLAGRGRYRDALAWMRRSLVLDPANVTYRYNLAVTLDRAGDHAAAVSAYGWILSAADQGLGLPPVPLRQVQARHQTLVWMQSAQFGVGEAGVAEGRRSPSVQPDPMNPSTAGASPPVPLRKPEL